MESLRCPRTGSSLRRTASGYEASEGQHSYPDVAGRTALMPSQSWYADAERVAAAPPARGGWLRSRVRKVPWPTVDLNLVSARNYRALRERIERSHSATAPARVLIVGGGELGEGIVELLGSESVEAIETDVYPGPRAQLLCDAHHLPFAAASFDLVVGQAVLEHVFDPPAVAAEIHRVLRPEALVYSEIPFMQQVHEGPFDVTRYTELGHRRLFRMFDELDRGTVGGPGMALAWSLKYLARSLPSRGGIAVGMLSRLATLLTSWVKHIDRLVLDHPGAADAASGTYFLGRRREQPVGDDEIVAGYRGAVPPVPR